MYRIYFWAVTLLTAILLPSCHTHTEDHSHEDDNHAEAEGHDHGIDEIVFTPEQAKRAGLEVIEVIPSRFAEVLEVSGRLLPAQGTEATVTATMSGIVRLSSIQLTDGTSVTAGTPLLHLDAAPIADGNPAAAAHAELTAARTALERAERLAAEQIISQRELEDARRRYETAEASARSLGNAQRVRTIVAPLGGYLKNILVKSGDYVTEGQPLLTVTQNRRLQLRADVPERHYGSLAQIRSANFRMSYEGPDHIHQLDSLQGRLLAKGQSVEAGEYFIPVTFEFNNEGNLVPGSLAQVYLLGADRQQVISVPLASVSEGQGLHFVYLQLSDHTYRRQEVRLGASDGQRVEICAGLQPGDRVVSRGTMQVKLAANASVAPEGHKH